MRMLVLGNIFYLTHSILIKLNLNNEFIDNFLKLKKEELLE
jgi:hypothetical protein